MLLLLFLRSSDNTNPAWAGVCPLGGVGAFQNAVPTSASAHGSQYGFVPSWPELWAYVIRTVLPNVLVKTGSCDQYQSTASASLDVRLCYSCPVQFPSTVSLAWMAACLGTGLVCLSENQRLHPALYLRKRTGDF